MKGRILALGLAVAVCGASTAWADDDIGCGWGTLAWQGKSGLAAKVLGATTNSTLGNQTFGITSGTAGCSSEGVIKADARLTMYAGANIDRLARDMAAGEGEALDTFALLLGVTDADRIAFSAFTKAHFAELFPHHRVTAGEMLTALNQLLASDAHLAKYATL
jgi:hypothetical protein